jgi:hypothetical protein
MQKDTSGTLWSSAGDATVNLATQIGKRVVDKRPPSEKPVPSGRGAQ